MGLLDFAPITDGASALILASEDAAKKLCSNPVYVLGIGSATDYLNYPAREDLTHFVATQLAMKSAAEKAKTTLSELQVVELCDQSTMTELVSLEDLGFCQPGTAWKSILDGCQNGQNFYNVSGRELYVNTDGGLKADGNPLGATGGAQIFEIYRQLRGEAGERQVKADSGSPKKGCVLEFEGFGTKSLRKHFGREEKLSSEPIERRVSYLGDRLRASRCRNCHKEYFEIRDYCSNCGRKSYGKMESIDLFYDKGKLELCTFVNEPTNKFMKLSKLHIRNRLIPQRQNTGSGKANRPNHT